MKIALIAHDKKKDTMIKLAIKYQDVLAGHELYATGTTGPLVMGETGLRITRMKSGPLGGDQQIGSMVAEGKLDTTDTAAVEKVFADMAARIESINVSFVMKARE